MLGKFKVIEEKEFWSRCTRRYSGLCSEGSLLLQLPYPQKCLGQCVNKLFEAKDSYKERVLYDGTHISAKEYLVMQ
jgi:hypothetical protein